MKTPKLNAIETLRAKGYVPAREAADKLGYSIQSIYDWLDDERIHGMRLGTARWVEWQSVVDYFKSTDPNAAKLLGIV